MAKETIKGFWKLNNVGSDRTQNERHPWKKETVKKVSDYLAEIAKDNNISYNQLLSEGSDYELVQLLVKFEGGRTRMKYKKKIDEEYGVYVNDEDSWFLYTRAGN